MEEQKIKHFVRISETDLEGKKPIVRALTKIYGVGANYANSICTALNLQKTKITGTLSESELKQIEEMLKNPGKIPKWQLNRQKDIDTGDAIHLTTSKLRLTKDNDIKRMKKNKSYRGMRHSWGQPVRGQRTRSNFRRGKTVGVQKKKLAPAGGKKG